MFQDRPIAALYPTVNSCLSSAVFNFVGIALRSEEG